MLHETDFLNPSIKIEKKIVQVGMKATFSTNVIISNEIPQEAGSARYIF